VNISRLISILLLAAAATAGAADNTTQPPLDTIAQRALACTPCHGKDGRAAVDGYYPRIAGKPAQYLFNQLVNFRDGRRFFPMMNYLADRQQEDFLRQLAEYFSSQHLPYAPPLAPAVDRSVISRGEQLVLHGDQSIGLPACSACHGTNLMGSLPAVPGLVGVSGFYLDAQLAAWKNGTRRANAPDCMEKIARLMSTSDLGAVTAWLSTRVVSEDAAAEPQAVEPLPMKCGSMEVDGDVSKGNAP
jgi:cytochrome c553